MGEANLPKAKLKASMGIGPIWGHSCLVWFGWLQCCSGNVMINLRLDFQGWKSTSNHWLSFKGSVPNAKQEGWSPIYELRGPQYEELIICAAKCKGLAFVTFFQNLKMVKIVKGRQQSLRQKDTKINHKVHLANLQQECNNKIFYSLNKCDYQMKHVQLFKKLAQIELFNTCQMSHVCIAFCGSCDNITLRGTLQQANHLCHSGFEARACA